MSPSEERLNPWLLPPSWQWAAIEEIADTTSGGTPRRDRPQFYGGTIPWLKSGELRDGVVHQAEESITEEALAASSAKLFPKGTVCIALYGATVGRLGILGFDASTNQAVCGIFHTNAVLPWFLFRFLQLIRQKLVELGKGGAQPNISQSIVRQTRVPVAPINEQQRILDEIDKQFTRLDAAVAALKRVQANLKRYRAAVLKAASEGRLVASASESSLTAGVGNPISLCPVVELISEPLANGRSPASATSGTKILRLTSMQDNFIDFAEFRFGNLDGQNRENLRLQDGDIFVARGSGSVHLVGRASLVRDLPAEYIAFPDTMIRIRLHSDIVDPLYFIYLWNSAAVRTQIEGIARTTAGIHKISQSDIERIVLPLVPLAEQRKVIAVLEEQFSVIDALESATSLSEKRAERLRQSILKRAFEGHLVPQAPNDEPANVLLEQIRASRSATQQSAPRALRGRRKKEATHVSR